MELITSLKNPRVLSWKSLKDKKGRLEQNAFLVEGVRMVQEALTSSFEVQAILLRENYIPDFTLPDSVPVYVLPSHVFQSVCDTKTPQGIAAVLTLQAREASGPRLLALDETLQAELQHSGRKVIIFHEAFPYFAEACGLPVAAVVNKEPEDDLSSAQLASILTLVRNEDPLPLIIKSAETDRSVDVLVSEAGLPVCELDPLTTGPAEPPLDYYDAVMLQNVKALLEAEN